MQEHRVEIYDTPHPSIESTISSIRQAFLILHAACLPLGRAATGTADFHRFSPPILNRPPDYQTTRLPDYQTTRRPDDQTTRRPNYQTTKLPNYQTTNPLSTNPLSTNPLSAHHHNNQHHNSSRLTIRMLSNYSASIIAQIDCGTKFAPSGLFYGGCS